MSPQSEMWLYEIIIDGKFSSIVAETTAKLLWGNSFVMRIQLEPLSVTQVSIYKGRWLGTWVDKKLLIKLSTLFLPTFYAVVSFACNFITPAIFWHPIVTLLLTWHVRCWVGKQLICWRDDENVVYKICYISCLSHPPPSLQPTL